MTSPSPCTPGSPKNGAKSSAYSLAPACSNGVAGTQLGSIMRTSSGSPFASASMYSIPSAPFTFAISCGSAITVVTPSGKTAFANSCGGTIDDSIWTWESIKDGASVQVGS